MGVLYLPSKRRPSWSDTMKVKRARGRNCRARNLRDGLVGYWPMNEDGGNVAVDQSGNNCDGTLTNGPTWTVGEFGRALDFAGGGADQHVWGPTAVVSTAPLTIAGFFVPDSVTGYHTIAAIGDTNAQSFFWLCWHDANVRAQIRNGAVNKLIEVGSLTIGKAAFAAAVFDGTGVSVYCNGASNRLAEWTTPTGLDNTTIGAAAFATGIEYDANGRIGNVPIWSRSLLSSEIQRLYAEPWCMGTLRSRPFPAAVAGFAGRKAAIIGGGVVGCAV